MLKKISIIIVVIVAMLLPLVAVARVNAEKITDSSWGAKPGDVNGDGVVDVKDLSIVLSNYAKTHAKRKKGDLNADRVVNVYDMSIVLTYWGE